ncbi:MAG: site-specific DNA-methyltransferase [Bacteroidales bacterium]|nr:site-specific DNA-methyltransferase [Candidatus Liminaster caballi]
MTQPKQRAGRNRTLTIEKHEAEMLRAQLHTCADVCDAGVCFEPDTLVHADIFEALPFVADHSADLIIIDPPYNLTRQFGTSTFTSMRESEYEDYVRSWMPSVCRKLKPNGSLYVCGDWKCTSALQRVLSEHLTIINRITWQREKGRGAAHNWKNGMEDIWFAVANPRDYYFDLQSVMQKRRVIAPYRADGLPKDWEATDQGNFRLTCPSNFWDDISVPFWSMPENTDHPTQKPEKLYAKLILASSRPGDVVLDPFMGSGTACVVAHKLGRRYLGIELEEEYCLYAAKRLMLADTDTSIQGYADGVFWERNTTPVISK